jgi:hypothetical protein
MRELQVMAVEDGKLVRWCGKPGKELTLSAESSTAEPAGVLNVVVWGCRGLLKGDAGGKSDPFVKLKLLQTKKRTQMIPNTLAPNFFKVCMCVCVCVSVCVCVCVCVCCVFLFV